LGRVWKEIGRGKRGSSRRGRGGVDVMMSGIVVRVDVNVNRMYLREEELYRLGAGCKCEEDTCWSLWTSVLWHVLAWSNSNWYICRYQEKPLAQQLGLYQ